MKFRQFMNMYDNWNGTTKVNDDKLDTIVIGSTLDIMYCRADFEPSTHVKNYEQLFKMEVVSFGFYDDEFCVRVKHKR